MTGPLNGMPYRSRHSVSHRLVDGSRYKSIIHSLPHVDSPFDCSHVESPVPIEKFTVENEPVATLSEAFGACFAEGGFEIRLKQNLSIVVVDGFPQLLDVGPAEMFGGYANGRVHQAEARFEMQCEKSPQRIDFRKVIRSPVVSKCSVASTRDAADVAQSKGINVGSCRKCPWATLRPACHSEFVVSQRVGDRCQVVGPVRVGACSLGTGLPYPGSIYAYES